MAILLLKTKSVIDDCDAHLKTNNAYGTEIESYLTQHLLVVLCAEIQQEIYRLTEERASIVGDTALTAYVAATSKKVLRSIGKSEIAGFVGMFGAECKNRLSAILDDSEVTRFNNVVSQRHDVAHKQGAQVTFKEMREAILIAEKVLNAVVSSLSPEAKVEEIVGQLGQHTP